MTRTRPALALPIALAPASLVLLALALLALALLALGLRGGRLAVRCPGRAVRCATG